MHRFSNRATTVFIAALCLFIGACASTATTSSMSGNKDTRKSSFNHFLVIGVAGDYTARAQFERTLASAIRKEGVTATAYYAVVRGNVPLSRDLMIETARTLGVDAVLVTRVASQEVDAEVKSGNTETVAAAKGGSFLNSFRYDYDELNTPATIDITSSVVLTTELFSAAEEKMIWSIETKESNVENVGELIDSASDSITRRLKRDRLVGQ